MSRFASSIRKVLSQLHPNTLISKSAVTFLNDCIINLCSWFRLYLRSNDLDCTKESTINFCNWLLTEELNKHAQSVINKTQYMIFDKSLRLYFKQYQIINTKFFAIMIEYIISEILELSGNCARDFKVSTIETGHIFIACKNDEELHSLSLFLYYNDQDTNMINENVMKISSMTDKISESNNKNNEIIEI
jgi:hypothetical protein